MAKHSDAASHATALAYDALGRVTQVTFPSMLSESYTYDAMNNLLTKGVVAQTSAFEVCGPSLSSHYRIRNQRSSEIFHMKSRGPQNRRSALRSFSRRLGVLRYLPGIAGYTYDAAGNRTSKTAVQQADPNPVSTAYMP